MIALIEATFFKFQYISGIERHFVSLLDLFDNSKLFKKIIIVTSASVNLPKIILSDIQTSVDVIHIERSDFDSWSFIYNNYNFDILYSTFEPPAILPVRKPVFYVLHDPGRYLFPELMEKNVLIEHQERFEKFINVDNFTVITVSNSSKNDIEDLFPVLKNKVKVIYNYSIYNTKKREFNINRSNKKYFLTVGRYMPTKNTLNLVKAFKNRDNHFNNFELLIIGRKGWYDEFENYMQSNNPPNVQILDFVSDEDLFNLYQNAYALIFPSIYEGFGLPIIEAIQAGCKRLFCSDIKVFREISPNNTVFFNPNIVDDIKNKAFSEIIPEHIYSTDSRFEFNTVLSNFSQLFKNEI